MLIIITVLIIALLLIIALMLIIASLLIIKAKVVSECKLIIPSLQILTYNFQFFIRVIEVINLKVITTLQIASLQILTF